MNEYTLVGQIVNTHGIDGVVKVYPYTDEPYRFEDLERVYLGEEKTPLDIIKVSIRKNMVYLGFRGYNNINEVLSMKTKYIYIPKEERIPLKENQFFIEDIIGSKVLSKGGENLGTVKDVLQGPGNDVLLISEDRGNWMLPMVKVFVLSVDPDKKVIIADPIEGMRL